MKGMIYRDGKFISVLSDVDANTLYEELPRNKKKREDETKKKKGVKKKKSDR